MNRSRRKQLIEEIRDSINGDMVTAEVATFIQQRPWTCVEVCYYGVTSILPIVGVGFSKVCRPDKWDAEFGRQLAISKAAAHIVKQLAEMEQTSLGKCLPEVEPLDVTDEAVGEMWVGPEIVDVVFAGAEV